ncbi:hypothetical protein HW273_07710 [Oribacterium sp. oral taxon 102]|uniref:hypothetical protein n=1 Tax=Oribacterium sp. oral taxon 102 TaxID=671214 RepID=UPI0015BF506C|nr:hypothetical protein [Oribacterium sp. oral taxon 102]NWO21781.1 hypothetical protein [Oribacterium sp. oral taxon 102]
MGQLIRITTASFEAVRVSGGGRLVPAEQIEAERRSALLRGILKSQEANVGSQHFTQEINHSYHRVQASDSLRKEMGNLQETHPQEMPQLSGPPATVPSPAETVAKQAEKAGRYVQTMPLQQTADPLPSPAAQGSSSYYQERAALEMRVQRGELSFLPPLNMMIVTQRPEIHIEYTGDFNYFPSPEISGENLNIES